MRDTRSGQNTERKRASVQRKCVSSNTTRDQRHGNCSSQPPAASFSSTLLAFFRCPDLSLCGCQLVRVPHPIAFFLHPDSSLPWSPEASFPTQSLFFPRSHLSLPLQSPEGDRPSLSFHILIHFSLCGPQLVSACTRLLSFHVLTSPTLYNLQLVSAPCSAAFFHVLTHHSLCGPQLMGIRRLVAFFLCPNSSLPLRSPEDAPCLAASFPFPGKSLVVPLAWSLSFHVLTRPSLQSPDCFFLCHRCFTIGVFLPRPSPSCCTPNLPAEEVWITQASRLDTCSALGHGRYDD